MMGHTTWLWLSAEMKIIATQSTWYQVRLFTAFMWAPREATVLIPTVLDLTVWHVATVQCGVVGVEILEFLPTPPMGPPLYGDTEFKHSAKKKHQIELFLTVPRFWWSYSPICQPLSFFKRFRSKSWMGFTPWRQCLLSNNLTIRKRVTTITLLEHAKHWLGESTSRYKHWGDCWRNLQVSACEIQITLIKIYKYFCIYLYK